MAKKLFELEKAFKHFNQSINIDAINREIGKLNDEIIYKASKQDTADLKEQFSIYNF